MVISAGNITDTMYLGVIQFGTETVHATSNVTTEFKSIYMDLEVNSAKATPTSSKGSSSATSTSKGGAMGMMPTVTSFAYPIAMGVAAVLAL